VGAGWRFTDATADGQRTDARKRCRVVGVAKKRPGRAWDGGDFRDAQLVKTYLQGGLAGGAALVLFS